MVKIFIIFYSIGVIASGGGSKPSGVTMEVLGNTDCGQEGQEQCAPWKKEFWDMEGFGCDRGLRTNWDWGKWRNYCISGTRRSANIIPWISDTLRFQRHLVKDAPIYNMMMIDAHNSMQETKAGPGFIQNQYYSITDLLNMGVRILSPDVHKFNRNMRVDHCTNEHLFCLPRSRYWSSWLEELRIWINKNPGEFVIVRVEPRNDGDWRNYAYPIEAIMGNITFTYDDFKANGMKIPSLQTLRNQGKRVVFLNFGGGSDGKWTMAEGGHFIPSGGPERRYVIEFRKDNCSMSSLNLLGEEGERIKRESWVGISESNGRILGLKLSDIFVDEIKTSGDVNIDAIKAAVKCGVHNIQMDWVENDHLAAAIWTWDVGEPRNFGTGLNCVKQKNGRWYTANCAEEKQFSCRNQNFNWVWRVTSEKGKFTDGNEKCTKEFGGDFIFDFPTRGDLNEIIRKLTGSSEIWLKYSHGNTETGLAGTFYIVPQISNKAVTEAGDSAVQFGYLGPSDNRQSWILNRDAQGFYEIKSKSNGRCLDSFQDGNNGKIGLWSCHGGDNQKWTLVVKGDSNLSLQNKRSRRCADISGSKKNNYDSLMGWDCYNVIQHYFKLYKQ